MTVAGQRQIINGISDVKCNNCTQQVNLLGLLTVTVDESLHSVEL